MSALFGVLCFALVGAWVLWLLYSRAKKKAAQLGEENKVLRTAVERAQELDKERLVEIGRLRKSMENMASIQKEVEREKAVIDTTPDAGVADNLNSLFGVSK